MNDLVAFATLVQALDPWRAHLIFIGGWAHRVHRLDPRANLLDYQAVFTKDSDLAFANQAPLEGDIRAALIRRSSG
ncbi:GSU2403 family nucleotidyltransferase fold protein [Mitsuaria sp. CC2]|uniref:GSU2403 family nucleotidyltransferase fold protein n=1 Tax=Mitsuaria sp. CC2 TaxID=3029186 RepID=UPI003B8B2D3E